MVCHFIVSIFQDYLFFGQSPTHIHIIPSSIWCFLFCHFSSFRTLPSWLHIINRNLQIINVLNRGDLFSTHKLSKRVLITYYYIHIKCYQKEQREKSRMNKMTSTMLAELCDMLISEFGKPSRCGGQSVGGVQAYSCGQTNTSNLSRYYGWLMVVTTCM